MKTAGRELISVLNSVLSPLHAVHTCKRERRRREKKQEREQRKEKRKEEDKTERKKDNRLMPSQWRA